ncbi:glycosyltransferase family 4 protein [Cyanobacterium aponinum FACHB-4101]|uniref:glycosyltransferase family 4 protein n=1 Tax=Cyanobacterium aponinum TaxID=379064 RepID=UPI001681341A|nr:glycosyltransferase family 4 protein [Cyanobacterium aponinum]MBD2395924.1 glycosyltransferase family 4 protein [Cyanobacterium aponinum FACHB-4101]
MKIIVLSVSAPFIMGGAEIHADSLLKALREFGYEAELVTIPFKNYPNQRILDTMLMFRLLDITESCGQKIDLVIPLKFPAYLTPHPNKVLWLLHQHRDAYDLWGKSVCGLAQNPDGQQIKDTIINADNRAFAECKKIYANSQNVANRLKYYNNVDSIPLYHPPQNAEKFYSKSAQRYFFFPSRLTKIKRQELILEAMAKTHYPVKVVFAGAADDGKYDRDLQILAEKLGIEDRAIFVGRISEEEKLTYYSECLGVIYPPFDEDYGYITLEGMLSSKPIISCLDSGGPLEFLVNQETGIIVDSTPDAIASAMDQLWDNPKQSMIMGKNARSHYESMNISWMNVIEKLTS